MKTNKLKAIILISSVVIISASILVLCFVNPHNPSNPRLQKSVPPAAATANAKPKATPAWEGNAASTCFLMLCYPASR